MQTNGLLSATAKRRTQRLCIAMPKEMNATDGLLPAVDIFSISKLVLSAVSKIMLESYVNKFSNLSPHVSKMALNVLINEALVFFPLSKAYPFSKS